MNTQNPNMFEANCAYGNSDCKICPKKMINTISITERPDKKTSELLEMCSAKFPVWSYYDDVLLDEDFPSPKEATIRYFLDSQEPDKETLSLSVREVEAKGYTQGITLRERILLELSYFEKHGMHMDIKGITFCSGSHDSCGDVPKANWNDSKFRVNWYNLDNSNSDNGVRSAVSPEPSVSSNLESAFELVKSHGYKIIKEF
jgi:hypothetical protein